MIVSFDDTRIAVERRGAGRPLLIVHGALNGAADWRPVAEALSDRFDCWLIDRRGRGASGDGPVHALAREVEDVVAVLTAAGGDAVLFGHSFGAVCALEAALVTSVTRLIVYEPPLLARDDTGLAAAFQALLDAGQPSAALEHFLVGNTGMPRAALDGLLASPAGARMRAIAWTFPREAEVLCGLEPIARYAAIAAPTFAVVGEHSPRNLVAATDELARVMPRLHRRTLTGQGHAAHRTGAVGLAATIADLATI